MGSLIGELQTIVSRRKNPSAPAVISVGEARAGSAPNVIPDTARLTGTEAYFRNLRVSLP